MCLKPKPQGGNDSGYSLPMSACFSTGKKNEGKCLAGTDGWFSCGKIFHKIWVSLCLWIKEQREREHLQMFLFQLSNEKLIMCTSE